MPLGLPRLPFGNLITSKQLISGQHINNLTALLTGTATGLTATPAGTQATSLPLNSWSNEITVVATANDGVLLPPAKSGLRVIVMNNDAADSAQVFASGTDVIFPGNVAGNVGVALAAAATAMFVCTKDGRWNRFVSA